MYLQKNSFQQYYINTLKGISQVMLIENIYTGLLFSFGVLFASLSMGFAMIFATLFATYFANKISLDKDKINSGLYGFNAALLGVAVVLFFGLNLFSIVLIVFGSIVTVLLQEFFMKKKLAFFTFPFIATTWLFLAIFNKSIANSEVRFDENLNLFSTIFKGFSEVFLQDSVVTGILFFIAIFIASKKASFFALFFVFLASFFAYILGFNLSEINLGLFAYNTVLCSMFVVGLKEKIFLYGFLALVLALIIQIIFIKINFVALTFPFVLTCFLILYFKEKI